MGGWLGEGMRMTEMRAKTRTRVVGNREGVAEFELIDS